MKSNWRLAVIAAAALAVAVAAGLVLRHEGFFGYDFAGTDRVARELVKEGHYHQAQELYEQALRMRTPNPETRFRLLMNYGQVLLAQNQLDAAYQAFLQAYTLNPRDPAVNFDVARIYAARGAIDGALTYLERARIQGFCGVERITHDPDFEAIQTQERFRVWFNQFRAACEQHPVENP